MKLVRVLYDTRKDLPSKSFMHIRFEYLFRSVCNRMLGIYQ